MFTVIVEKSFAAKHQITLPDGGKEPLHSHDWQVAAAVSAEKLDVMGLAFDFVRLGDLLEQVLAPMRNRQLETMDCFRQVNASAENVARHIYDKLSAILPGPAALCWVEVAEAPGCKVRYCP